MKLLRSELRARVKSEVPFTFCMRGKLHKYGSTHFTFRKAKYITNPTAHKDKILSLRAAGFYHLSPITAAVTALAKRLTASVMPGVGNFGVADDECGLRVYGRCMVIRRKPGDAHAFSARGG